MTYIIKEVCRKKGSIFIEYTSFWKNEGVFAIAIQAIHTHTPAGIHHFLKIKQTLLVAYSITKRGGKYEWTFISIQYIIAINLTLRKL